MKDYKLNVVEKISISPSKCTLTTSITKSYKNSLGFWEYKERTKSSNQSSNKLKKQFHNFTISKNSQRNLRQKIEYLFLYAKSRKIKTYNGKKLPSFKVVFLTLKLPSKQRHPSSQIITDCLQPFMDLLRKRLGMKNYVYRVEYQNNGNIHFHICTDTYVDYYFAQKHWNKMLEKLGYITAFSDKMSKMSFKDYYERYGVDFKGNKIDFEVVKQRYIKGKKSKWRNPNSVDVKNAKGGDNIAYYISKYFAKEEKGAKQNELDNEENSFALRLCYWSRSLSQMKPESMPVDYYDVNIFKELLQDESVIICRYDYCTVIYFEFNKMKGFAKEYLKKYFKELQNECSYIPAD